jgi:hypothetical protein
VATLAYFAGPTDDLTKLRIAAGRLVHDLNFAQADTIANQQAPRFVVFHNQGYHVAAAADVTTPLANEDGEPYAVAFGAGSPPGPFKGIFVLRLSVGDDNMLGFGTLGQLDQASVATITLAASSYSITVTVDPISGVASLSEPYQHDTELLPTVHRVEGSDGTVSRGL